MCSWHVPPHVASCVNELCSAVSPTQHSRHEPPSPTTTTHLPSLPSRDHTAISCFNSCSTTRTNYYLVLACKDM